MANYKKAQELVAKYNIMYAPFNPSEGFIRVNINCDVVPEFKAELEGAGFHVTNGGGEVHINKFNNKAYMKMSVWF